MATDPVVVVKAVEALAILPVVTVGDAADAAPLAAALRAGGLPCAEVTFRTPAAAGALATLSKDPDLLLGAGTVLSVDQVDRALAAGARFIVTPGFSRDVVRACQERNVAVFPGVATATEIQMALDEGLETLKFFPAEALGGVAALRALSAAFDRVRFIPTGGISTVNLAAYLRTPSVLAVGGSWLAAPDLIRAARFDEITRRTRDAVTTVRDVRRDTPAS